jgi:hypothetical protein
VILLCGVASERTLASVYEALLRLGAAVTVYDQRTVLDAEIELVCDSEVRGKLRTAGTDIDLDEVTAAYMRPFDSRQVASVTAHGGASPESHHALNVDDCLWLWAELTPALVLNRPSAMASNGSKPFQAEIIRRSGFEIPETLITTDSEAVLAFHAQHGDVIYKSISGVRSIVSRVTAESLLRLSSIEWCPTQFQKRVGGVEYRVHVVGDEVFACRILSEADDYRYAARQGFSLEIEACELPLECAERCRLLVREMGLLLGGIDLRLSPDGRWYCFEVNPSPGFTYYQGWTNQPIDEAIARLLISNSDRHV